ncbi:MAG: metallophosphoesterase [Candidatus Diapherotrites archaeon]
MAEVDRKRQILEYCAFSDKNIELQAVDSLCFEDDWKSIIDSIDDFFITHEKVRELLHKRQSKVSQSAIESVVILPSKKCIAKEESSDYKVLKEYEANEKSRSSGKVDDFLAYFRNKYDFLSSLFSGRSGFNPKPVDKLKSVGKNESVDLVGMVFRKWVSKNGNLSFELDSPEGNFIVIVSKDDVKINVEAQKILVDDVIGVHGKKFSDNVVIAKSFLFPDLPQKPLNFAKRDLSLCLISDIHVGSKLFLRNEFLEFISWLNAGSGNAGKIKYLFIAGDNVDGVGVYPTQYDELEIKDVFEQYDVFADFVSMIPEYIEVFICPGQHDATRRSDPQPPILKEYAKKLYELSNVHLIGSPSWVEVEGLKTLVYHGGSFHDMYAVSKHLDNKEPHKAMIEMLRRRDLSTGFGFNQPYVPLKNDLMVIRHEPDFYFGGDLHHKGYANYRGCTVANAGCWQGITSFQIKEGHVPTPCISLEINLKSRKIIEHDFSGVNNERH